MAKKTVVVAARQASLPTSRRNEASLRQRIVAMQEIGQALASTLALDDLLARIMSEVTRLMGAERSTLFLFDKSKREIWSKVLQGTELKEIRLALGKGVAGWVAEKKKIVRIDHPYKDPRFDASFDTRSGFKTSSILCAPIMGAKKHLVGVVQVLNRSGGPFDEDDEHMLAALCTQIAVALENAKLYRQLELKARALEQAKHDVERAQFERDLLFTIERQVGVESDVTQLLDGIISVAMKAIGAEAGSISLIDEETGELYFKSALGVKGEEVKKIRLKVGEGVIGFVAHTGQPVMVNDPGRDGRHKKTIARKLRFAARSIICAPMQEGGDVLGAFELLNKTAGTRESGRYAPFTQEDLKLLTLLAGQAARTLSEARRRTARAHEERLKTIGQAMAGVVHDFRTPMTVIGGYTHLLASEPEEGKRMEMAEIMSSQIDHMNAMVGELLGFARGDTTVYKRKVYLDHFVEDLRSLFSGEAAQRKVDFTIYLRTEGTAQFDPVKIKRVLTNLVRNGIESIKGPGKVVIVIEKSGVDLHMSVKDTGQGVPAEIEGRLFEQFVTAGKKNGTGLGLAVCKRIVEDHGGSISCTSKVDRGTTFAFTLPKAMPVDA